MIVLGGMIGLGKTTTAKMLGERLNVPVYYESVDDNRILPYYYQASPADQLKYRYPFLLQLAFLKSRYSQVRLASKQKEAVLDRSIYEDAYFIEKNREMGRLSETEAEVYKNLFNELMEENGGVHKKAPEVMVYLTGPFELALERIRCRGRSIEMGKETEKYLRFLYEGYDNWFYSSYKASPSIVVDVSKRKVNDDLEDQEWLLSEIRKYIAR